METWPNFFIVGAPKAGTTSLYEYLKNIPEIFMSSIKEPNFFSENTISENYPITIIRKKLEYLSLFDKVQNEKIIGESSTSYLSDPETPHKIHKINPNSRILISLRDPVERAFSHYLMHKRTTWLTSSLHEELQNSISKKFNHNQHRLKLEHGLYFNDIRRYQEIFGKNQVTILIFEEFIKNKKESIEKVLKFLGINHDVNYLETKSHNPYRGIRGERIINYLNTNNTRKRIIQKIIPINVRRSLREKIFTKQQSKPEMAPSDREVLINYYREDVEKLQNFLGRKLPWPNF